jgi:hypothetical protein
MTSGITGISSLQTIHPKLLVMLVLAALLMVILMFFLKGKTKDTRHSKLEKSQTPGMPKIPMHAALPNQKAGGKRDIDGIVLTPETETKRVEAFALIDKGKIVEGAQILDSINLKREAIDILEQRGLIDEAAALLMTINRPNRAAVIYERHKKYEHAALYYLRAKLVEDAKRCCKQIKEFPIALSTELAVLFAEAGDNKSALRLLAGINDKSRIMKIVREKFAYADLAEFLDYPAARLLLLETLTQTDFGHMMEALPKNERSSLGRAVLWINEGKKPEWLTAVFAQLGDQRGTATGFADKIHPDICKAYGEYLSKIPARDVTENRQTLEWAARAFHDSSQMLAAALIYEKIHLPILAGKCFAIAGESLRALGHLRGSDGDLSLAANFEQELDRLGRFTTDQKPLTQPEKDALMRVFFNVDPDTERNRVQSPFSIAS